MTRGEEALTEDSERGDGFLADVVADWEDATAPAAQAGRPGRRAVAGATERAAAAVEPLRAVGASAGLAATAAAQAVVAPTGSGTPDDRAIDV